MFSRTTLLELLSGEETVNYLNDGLTNNNYMEVLMLIYICTDDNNININRVL